MQGVKLFMIPVIILKGLTFIKKGSRLRANKIKINVDKTSRFWEAYREKTEGASLLWNLTEHQLGVAKSPLTTL